jgi:ketosteroid isomerase-like protein
MHPNAQLLTDFYAAFTRRDGNAMAAYYHPDAEFSDPVFPGLRHARVTSMWRMLCERGTDLELTLVDVQADDRSGRARWEARYTFSMSGKKVLNRVSSEFEFKDGKILRQTDRFGFWRWARQHPARLDSLRAQQGPGPGPPLPRQIHGRARNQGSVRLPQFLSFSFQTHTSLRFLEEQHTGRPLSRAGPGGRSPATHQGPSPPLRRGDFPSEKPASPPRSAIAPQTAQKPGLSVERCINATLSRRPMTNIT